MVKHVNNIQLDDLAMLIAQQYYVEHGADTRNVSISAEQLQQYLPAFVITAEKPLQYWHQMVSQAFSRVRKQNILIPLLTY